MTPEERKLEEEQIKNSFSELQKKLDDLKSDIQRETDDSKKQEKQAEIQKMEKDLSEMKTLIDKLSLLQEQDLQSLKTRLEQYSQVKQDVQGETTELLNQKMSTPTTYELLKDSETCNRLLNIISSNPKEFSNLPWNTPEKKLEYIFEKIRTNIVLFMKNKLWNSKNAEKIINNTIAPSFEWSLMELLRDQWNETNVNMLKWIDKISWDSFNTLITWVWNLAKKTKWSFNKFNQWINAIDYLSVHNWVLNNPEKSEVLTNPNEFKNYLNNAVFASEKFSPYVLIDGNIFKVDENQSFEFGMSLQDKQDVLSQIWNIQVVDSPKTTALIASMLDKPEKFLWAVPDLQNTANHLLDWVNTLNSVTKFVGLDLLWEITKPPEKRGFWYRIIDFVCKLIWITWWIEWIVKRWRLDRLKLTDEKNKSITKIFEEYQNLVWRWNNISITDANSCSSALADFVLTDINKLSTTKWDYLRDVMADNMDINFVPVSVVQQTLWDNYLKKEVRTVNWKQQEEIIVDVQKITEQKRKELVHLHITNMKAHLEWNYDDLKDFYSNIHNADDLVICMTASLYADKEDVIEWIKAKVFLPENYGVTHQWNIDNWNNSWIDSTLSELTSQEKTEMQDLVEKSKTPNTINYLENATYKKYLNIIERNLKLPKYALECVCRQESFWWYLYRNWKITWSDKGAQGLFQFMPETADQYMAHNELKEKYWKTFTSRDEFLKDPLATAWVAWIMYSEFMYKYNYNFQTSLACYNRWIDNYQKGIGKKNLEPWDLNKLPKETKWYVETISKDVLEHNSANSNDIFADLWTYSRDNGWVGWSSMA